MGVWLIEFLRDTATRVMLTDPFLIFPKTVWAQD